MAVAHSMENIPAAYDSALGVACSLCESEMNNLDNCLSTICNHIFHKECIINWLSKETECPNCRKLCHKKDLVPPGSKSLVKPSKTNISSRGRGSYSRYNTRNKGLNTEGSASPAQLIQSSNVNDDPKLTDNEQMDVPLLDFNLSFNCPDRSQNSINPLNPTNCSNNRNNTTQSSQQKRGTNRKHNKDYYNFPPAHISQIIETSVQRVLSQLNIAPQAQTFQNINPNIQPNWRDPTFRPSESTLHPPTRNTEVNHSHVDPGKATNILQSWNVRFDGSSKGLRANEFVYRIECLTRETLQGNMQLICNNLQMLLHGKAREWFWRYHKSVEAIEWEPFCSALLEQYKDHRTTYDIREELNNRKQKPNESFESFYDSIMDIIDHLTVPLEEHEIVEILFRNLRPEIRHELLYVKFYSIAELKKLCLKRETLLREESFKRNYYSRTALQRRIAAIEGSSLPEDNLETLNTDMGDISINAVSKPEFVLKCWNCDEDGHKWDMCLKERIVFCYGCGLKNVYKPNCQFCSKNLKQPRGNYTQVPHNRN